jgi:hypothetical protein
MKTVGSPEPQLGRTENPSQEHAKNLFGNSVERDWRDFLEKAVEDKDGQILARHRSAISVWRGTVVTRRGSARFTYLLPSFLGKNTIKSLQVPDQFPPFHLHLELLDHHFTLRKFG